MEIKVTETETKPYRPMFATEDITIKVAVVKFPAFGVTMGLSHRSDDPAGMWLADWRIEANGNPVFSHGEGDRSCVKSIAGDELTAAIEEAFARNRL